MKKQQFGFIALALVVSVAFYAIPKSAIQLKKAGKEANRDEAKAPGTEKPQAAAPEPKGVDDGHDHGSASASASAAILQLKADYAASKTATKGKALAKAFAKGGVFDSAAFYYESALGAAGSTEDRYLAGEAFYNAFSTAATPAKGQAMAAKAQAYLKDVLKAEPGNATAKTKLAMTYIGSETPMQGIILLKEVVAADPRNEEALFNLGTLSMQSGQYAKAIDRFGSILSINSKNNKARFYLALSLKETGKLAEAIAQMEEVKALDKDPAVQTTAKDYLAEWTAKK